MGCGLLFSPAFEPSTAHAKLRLTEPRGNVAFGDHLHNENWMVAATLAKPLDLQQFSAFKSTGLARVAAKMFLHVRVGRRPFF